MHGPQLIRPIENFTAESQLAGGANHIARDCAGLNFYEIDRGLRDLLPLYLAEDDHRQLAPHFHRLGGLAGGRLDELARIADKNPRFFMRATALAATRTGSTITRPTARWKPSPSVTFSFTP